MTGAVILSVGGTLAWAIIGAIGLAHFHRALLCVAYGCLPTLMPFGIVLGPLVWPIEWLLNTHGKARR